MARGSNDNTATGNLTDGSGSGHIKVRVLAYLFGAISILSLGLGLISFIWPTFLSLFISPTSFIPFWVVALALVVYGIIGVRTSIGLNSLHLWAWIVALVLSILPLLSGLVELMEGVFTYPILGLIRSIIWIIVISYLLLVLGQFRAASKRGNAHL